MKVRSEWKELQPVQPRPLAVGSVCFGFGPPCGQLMQSSTGDSFLLRLQ